MFTDVNHPMTFDEYIVDSRRSSGTWRGFPPVNGIIQQSNSASLAVKLRVNSARAVSTDGAI